MRQARQRLLTHVLTEYGNASNGAVVDVAVFSSRTDRLPSVWKPGIKISIDKGLIPFRGNVNQQSESRQA